MACGIYTIVGPMGHHYVGSSVNIDLRFNSHRSMLNRKIHPNKHLQNAWLKYGSEDFDFKVLELVAERDKLIEREQRWCDHFAPNIYNYGECVRNPNTGRKRAPFTFEHRAKIGAAFKGRKRTLEQIEFLRRCNLGRKRTAEQRAKLSERRRGLKNTKPHSLESRQKLSLARKGWMPFSRESLIRIREKSIRDQAARWPESQVWTKAARPWRRKLGEDAASTIRLRILAGETRRTIATEYRISRTTVSRIMKRPPLEVA